MKQRTRLWIDEQLTESEERATCYAPRLQKEQKRMQRAAQEGYVVEVSPMLFARASYWQNLKPASQMRHWMRGLQDQHPDWIFAGPSAALAWGLSVSNRYLKKVWVATTRRAHGKELPYRHDIIVSHSEVATYANIRLTSFARTVGDCLRIMDFRSGLAVVDSALRVGRLAADVLLNAIERECQRISGIRRMRAMVPLGDARAESGGESIARATMMELGIKMPELQRVFTSPLMPEMAYRVDFAWPAPGLDSFLVGELDGFEKYENPLMTEGRTTAQVIEGEHRRQTCIEACPEVLRVLRFGFSDIMCEQEFLKLLMGCGVPRSYELDAEVLAAGGILRCRA